MTTLADTYADGLATFQAEVANLLGSEERVAGDLDHGIATIADSLSNLARAYAERVDTVRFSREMAMNAAEVMNQAARQLGLEPVCTVPSSRITVPPGGRGVHRAAAKGVDAIARALADAALQRISGR